MLLLSCTDRAAAAESPGLGVFSRHADVGEVQRPGSVVHAEADRSYRIAGGGENMWFDKDAFHFVWKEVAGDVSLAAEIGWTGTGGNAHRKACLMIRQSLDAGSPYIDAVVHGDGLTSLQFRESPGGPTREIQANLKGPKALRIERRGEWLFLSAGAGVDQLERSGCAHRLRFADPVYVGLAVCAHDNKALEQAVFSQVQLVETPAGPVAAPTRVRSVLETIAIGSKDRRVVYHATNLFEAPNWSRDGRQLVFNGQGRLHRIAREGGAPELIDTGFANRCNNDHGISPDGSQLVISDQSKGGKSLIYILPFAGGTPTLVTTLGPSYWHGWSPDGRTLAYCAERNGEYDVYTIPVGGGEEKRLTLAAGLDDGPDYSADGQWIYFNSERTGLMQIWRMKTDGSDLQQVTNDGFNDWFPHPSPDGKWIVFLSYAKDVKGHPANKDVQLRLMPVQGAEIQVLARLFGGQGTINVPSWSPDSRQVAFVSYQPLLP